MAHTQMDSAQKRIKQREQTKRYYAKHPGICGAISRRSRQRRRHDAIMTYGGYECVCDHNGKQCGTSDPEFLSIDHINGGGFAHRKATKTGNDFYLWLRMNDYPPGFRVLCHNCNQARGFYGRCPRSVASGNLEDARGT